MYDELENENGNNDENITKSAQRRRKKNINHQLTFASNQIKHLVNASVFVFLCALAFFV